MASLVERIRKLVKRIKYGPGITEEQPVAPPPPQQRPQRNQPRSEERDGNRRGRTRQVQGERRGEKPVDRQGPRPPRQDHQRAGQRPPRQEQPRGGARVQKPEPVPLPPVIPELPPWDPASFVVAPEEGKTRFHDLSIPNEILHAVAELNFQYCTPVQAEILPKALQGLDATGRAQTGTGKTAAFLIAIFTHLLRTQAEEKRKPGSPRALILAPTRELVMQIEKDALALSKFCPGLRTVAVYGGVDYVKQKRALEHGLVDVIVATPGRLLDFKAKGGLSLAKVEIMVIDEADRMLDMGFIPDVRRIIESTPPKTRRQTLLFSATLTPEVVRLASRWTKDAFTVEIAPEQVTTDSVDQKVYIVTADDKFKVLYNMIVLQKLERVMVFCNRRDESQAIARKFADLGIDTGLLSGDVAQDRRIKTLEAFRGGSLRVLVATDVAARGLHIEDVSHVVNFSLPLNPDDYVHRIGRTGRAGASGISVSFADEMDAQQLPSIEEYIGKSLSCVYPEEAWLTEPVAVQAAPAQLMVEPAPRFDNRRRGGRTYGGRKGSRPKRPHSSNGGKPSPEAPQGQ